MEANRTNKSTVERDLGEIYENIIEQQVDVLSLIDSSSKEIQYMLDNPLQYYKRDRRDPDAATEAFAKRLSRSAKDFMGWRVVGHEYASAENDEDRRIMKVFIRKP